MFCMISCKLPSCCYFFYKTIFCCCVFYYEVIKTIVYLNKNKFEKKQIILIIFICISRLI